MRVRYDLILVAIILGVLILAGLVLGASVAYGTCI